MERDDLLARDGWSNRGDFDEPRLSDIVEMYEEAGFEVRLEPFDPASVEGCTACMMADPQRYRTVFTRRKV